MATTGKKKKASTPVEAVKNLFGKGTPVPTPGKVAEKNRKHAEEIKATLRAVNFGECSFRDDEGASEEKDFMSVKDMALSTRALIKKIEDAPTIFDDITELDDIVLFAAQSLKTAVDQGYRHQAQWSILAISYALLYLRDNLPPEQKSREKEIMAARIEYMKKYQSIIKLYGEIDARLQSIEDSTDTLEQRREEYLPLRDEILELDKTPEGKQMIARINAHQNDPGQLTPDEKDLATKADKLGHMATNITLLRDQIYAMTVENEGKISIALAFRTALDNAPALYDRSLIAEYNILLDEIVNGISVMLDNAKEILDAEKAAEAKLKTVMNGSSAQAVIHRASEIIDELTIPQNRDDTRTKLEMQIREQRKMETQKSTQTLFNTSGNMDEVFDFAANDAVNMVENTVSVEEVNLNYNS